jgi:deoxyribonuclease IV
VKKPEIQVYRTACRKSFSSSSIAFHKKLLCLLLTCRAVEYALPRGNHPLKNIPLIGSHISIAGGLHMALLTGKEIGATTIQIFTANQRTWNTKSVSDEEALLFHQALKETGLACIMSHDSYLINLGSPHTDIRQKSIAAFRREILRCLALGISFLNFHPGAALDSPVEVCMNAISEAILLMADCFDKNAKLLLLLETMAGQGSVIGSKFEEIAYIIDNVKGKIPIGVCMDTCHTFAAGYDVRTKEALAAALDEFDRVIGLKYLKAMHLNDSVFGRGSHKDRHAPIGYGMIGKEGFSAIMKEPRLALLPKYLETPGGLEVWEKEIAWLKRQLP